MRSAKVNLPKRQHIVPVAYLSYFQTPDAKEQIYVYDKITGKSFVTSVNNVSAQKDFYRVRNSKYFTNEDEYYYEKMFSRDYETDTKRLFNTIITKCNMTVPGKPILSADERADLSRIIACQLLRTQPSVSYATGLAHQSTEDVLLRLINHENQSIQDHAQTTFNALKSKDKELEEYIHSLTMATIFDEDRVARFAEIISKRAWVFFGNPFAVYAPYITSDSPVILINTETSQLGLGNNGLALVTSQIHYPITPSILLAFYHPDYFFGQLLPFDNTFNYNVDMPFIVNSYRCQMEACHRHIMSNQDLKFLSQSKII